MTEATKTPTAGSADAGRPCAPGCHLADTVRTLLAGHRTMLGRQHTELAPFKDEGGSLLGNDYDDHDSVHDRHVEERLQMLDAVMAALFAAPDRHIGRPSAEAQGPSTVPSCAGTAR